MRNSLKKIALACAATMALSVMSVSAATLAETTDFTYDATAGTVSVVTDSALVSALTTGQYTVLIYEKTATTDETNILDSEIVYINQAAKDALGDEFVGMGLKNGLEEGKTYVLKIGGTNVAASGILAAEFTVGGAGDDVTFIWGDVDCTGAVDGLDASAIINGLIGGTTEYGDFEIGVNVNDDVIWGDVDCTGAVDGLDASAIINGLIGGTTEYGDFEIGAEAVVAK